MGHLDSPHYIGAVAMGSFTLSLILATFGFLRMATTGFVAQAAGANDGAMVLTHFWRAISVAIILGLLTIMLIPVIIFLAGMTLTMSDDVSNGMSRYLAIVAYRHQQLPSIW